MKLLSGNQTAIAEEMLVIDGWTNRVRAISLIDAKRADCPTCGRRRFDFLNDATSRAVQLCGRSSVQIRSADVDFQSLRARLANAGDIQQNAYFIRCDLRDEHPIHLTVFTDGRTIVHGTTDLKRARAIHARYVGS